MTTQQLRQYDTENLAECVKEILRTNNGRMTAEGIKNLVNACVDRDQLVDVLTLATKKS